eukprot:TRINITY_DN21570_c0_g1_i1.p1 TRINITY_DN21570_c0_g1~~TRINITY_DN21570_c0_g1_i1.p1  ORF type:complete len:279 (+),score=29.97 TRINITY_DN21570_c0_g1_i1:85-921(+)
MILTSILYMAVASQLIGIGDLHGDYDKAIAVLRLAGVIPSENEHTWTGGDTTIVQLGDVYDRGPEGTKILRLLRKLKTEAKTHGGDVITIMGNHELMNLQGVQAYVHPEEYATFESKKDRRLAFGVQGEMGQFLRESPPIALINGTVFVHGGMTRQVAKLGVNQIRSKIESEISSENWRSPLLGANGPLWTRDMITQATHGDCSILDSVIAAFNAAGDTVTRLAVGHTIQGGGKIGIHCGGRLVATDVAMSRYIIRRGFLACANLTTPTAVGVYNIEK